MKLAIDEWGTWYRQEKPEELWSMHMTMRDALIAAAVTLAACVLAGWSGLYALGAALAGSLALLLYARHRLGGVTGDVFGCTVECTEWIVLLTFCTAL